MGSIPLVLGCSLQSDFEIIRFDPQVQPGLPEPLCNPKEACRTGFLTLAFNGPYVWFGDNNDTMDRYVLINCDIPSINYVRVAPTNEYEVALPESPVSIEYRYGIVEIDLGLRQIRIINTA